MPSDIRATISALEAGGSAKIKANPRVATLDGQEARIRVGSEAYYTLLSGSVTYSYYTLEKIATGIVLKITPYTGNGGDIVADISVEVSDVRGSGANDLPVTSVREVQTRARVGNGETLVLGGLFSESDRQVENRIPLLGRIPILGWFFGQTTVEEASNEVVVLVTPYILIDSRELSALLD
jgi:type II secretory pathway component GspD/PulD (secretin)